MIGCKDDEGFQRAMLVLLERYTKSAGDELFEGISGVADLLLPHFESSELDGSVLFGNIPDKLVSLLPHRHTLRKRHVYL